MPTEPRVSDVIDVYTDVVPGPRQRVRGQHHSAPPLSAREHDFRTPDLPTPVLKRPATWAESTLDRHELLTRASSLESEAAANERRRRLTAVALVLDWLEGFAGESWQQRWLASGADEAGAAWTATIALPGLLRGADGRAQLTGGAGRLILLGAVRPSYNWIYRFRSGPFMQRFRNLRDPDGFARLDDICAATPRFTRADRNFAYHQLSRILIHNGGMLADITVEDCIEAYRAQVGYTARQHGHWYRLLAQAGVLPPGAPPTVWAASRRGQLRVEELVDGYRVACRPVRNLLVDYLREREAGMDYSSLRQLASKLALLFWRDLELHEPGIDSLQLSDDVARRWKDRLHHVSYGSNRAGKLREDPNSILIAVRAFYADISHWALEDPRRWARWVAPNPVTGRDLLGQNKQKRRATARMHQRTRELAPILPALVAAAARQRRRAEEFLVAARTTESGELFEVGGERLRRVVLATERTTARPGVVYARASEGGPRRNLTLEDENAFWSWAIVEVLRHTGVRVEEMLEITHRSLAAYTLPTTGEVIPLLQITPSKTDRERLLVVSPELAEVLAVIIKRVRAGNEHVPLVARYDYAERVHSPPLPFLFQRPWGLASHAITHGRVKVLLDRTAIAAKLTGADGKPLRFTPHDFRRIFATEAVATGLPVHITAKLLGHDTLATTQAYIAVYDNDVIDHHRAFIARRRALRPGEEYREPTDTEWEEFLGHFERRKVELGICGRAYGTPCQHEHACIRCPMLRPDPAQSSRLTEIIDNLRARLTEAHEHGWLGEIEGLEVSLAAAEQKLAAMHRAANRTTVELGLPGFAPPHSGSPRTRP